MSQLQQLTETVNALLEAIREMRLDRSDSLKDEFEELQRRLPDDVDIGTGLPAERAVVNLDKMREEIIENERNIRTLAENQTVEELLDPDDEGDGLQPGDIILQGGTSRAGSLLCDGTSYLRATWPELFTAIGTAYGSADGTHFNVPNAKGRIPVGVVGGSGVVDGGGVGDLGETNDYAAPGESGGKAWHGATENGHPDHVDHVHLIPDQQVASGAGPLVSDATDSATSIQVTQPVSGDMTQRHGGMSDGVNTWVAQSPVNEAGDKNDTDNRQPWLTMNFFIKT